MTPSKDYKPGSGREPSIIREGDIETALIKKLEDPKYKYRPDIRDRASLEANFRQKFEELNRVQLTDAEFARLLDEIVMADVFTASRTFRARKSFFRDGGTPLKFPLVNIRDRRNNHLGAINNFRIKLDNSDYRPDGATLINRERVVRREHKHLSLRPFRRTKPNAESQRNPCTGHPLSLIYFRASTALRETVHICGWPSILGETADNANQTDRLQKARGQQKTFRSALLRDSQ